MHRITFDKHGQNFMDRILKKKKRSCNLGLHWLSLQGWKNINFLRVRLQTHRVFHKKTHRFSPQVESSNPPEFLRKTHQFSPPIDPPFPPQFSGKSHDFSPWLSQPKAFLMWEWTNLKWPHPTSWKFLIMKIWPTVLGLKMAQTQMAYPRTNWMQWLKISFIISSSSSCYRGFNPAMKGGANSPAPWKALGYIIVLGNF